MTKGEHFNRYGTHLDTCQACAKPKATILVLNVTIRAKNWIELRDHRPKTV